MLTRDQILNADDRKTIEIDIPEWGGSVRIAELSGFTRDKFEESIVNANGGTNMNNIRAKLVAASVVDEKGDPLFSDKDVAKLGKKSSVALDRIFAKSRDLNKISDDDVEDLAKN